MLMDKLRLLIMLLALTLTLGASAQSRKTTTRKSTTTTRRSSTTTKKGTTTKKTATTTKKTTPATTTTKTTTTTTSNSAKQDYKEGYNEGFEAGLRAAQQNGIGANNTSAKTDNSKSSSKGQSFISDFKSSFSQKPAETKNAMFAEFQAVFDVNGGPVSNHLYEIDLGYLRKTSENVRLGFGLGFMGDFRFNNSPLETIPVFLRGQVNVPTTTDITPFINMDLGYVLNDIEDLDFEDCPIRVNPSVGAYFGQAYVAVGYLGQIIPVSNAKFQNYVNLKLGVKMGDRPKSYKTFKSSYFTLEASGGPTLQTSYNEYDSSSDNGKKKMTYNGAIDMHWMFPLGDHVAIGPGVGAHYFQTSTTYGGSKDDPRYGSESTIYFPLTVRAEGTFFDKDATIRPYAAADLGVVVGCGDIGGTEEVTYNSPTFEIQGGVKLNNKVRVGAGIEFNYIDINSYYAKQPSQTLTSINAHIGIDF